MNSNTREMLSEKDFMLNEDRRLQTLAGMIRVCGETVDEIAQGCRLDKRTVQRALSCRAIKSDAQARLEFYIRRRIYENGRTEV